MILLSYNPGIAASGANTSVTSRLWTGASVSDSQSAKDNAVQALHRWILQELPSALLEYLSLFLFKWHLAWEDQSHLPTVLHTDGKWQQC